MSLDTEPLTLSMLKLEVAISELHEAWVEFGRLRRTGDQVRHVRRVREDPTYVPYVFESAEERADRRRKLHEKR